MEEEDVLEHLDGFTGYVRQIYGGNPDARGKLIVDRIFSTSLVVGIEIDPGRDAEGRAEEIVGKLCYGLSPMIFFEDSLLDANCNVILGPDGSYDSCAEIS